MTNPEDKLSALLKSWRDLEPKPSFEANVWRRIRLAEQPKPSRAGLAELLCGWLRKPVWLTAVAVVVSVVFAATISGFTASKPAPEVRGELQFLGPDTLSGGYLKVAAEGAR